MPGGGGGMNTKRSRAVSRGGRGGGSEDGSPSFQIKDGEIVVVGDTKTGEDEKEQYYIRLDQEGVVPPPFDRSLIGKAEDGEQRGGERRAASRKRKNAHKKRQGVSRKGSMRYINIPSRIGIALDSVKAARLKSTFYDKLYQEKKAREEKLLANTETTEVSQSSSLSADTCERALAKVRKSRSGPFYLNHLSLYVKSTESGPSQRDHRGDAGGGVSLKSRSPSHSKVDGSKTFAEYDDLYHLIQRSKNCKPRDLPITNVKSSSTGIFYKAKSEKMRRQSRWSPPDSVPSCPSDSYSDSPKIVNAAHDWVECDASGAANDDTPLATNKSARGDDPAQERELENAREKAIREATGLDFKSLKLKLDLLLRNSSETRENKRVRSISNQKSPEPEILIPLQITDVLCSKPTAAIKNLKSKRNKRAYKKSPQRQRKQADSQPLAKSPKKRVAFAVFDSPLECSNNRSDTGDNDETAADNGPRIIQASEPDNRGLQSVSVRLSVSQRHVAQELSVVSEISGASENLSTATKSLSVPAARVRISPEDRCKGKYLTAIGQKTQRHTVNQYLLKKSPAKDAEIAGKVTPNVKTPEPSSDNTLRAKPEEKSMTSALSPRSKARRSELYLKTSPQRVIRGVSSLEVKSANREERADSCDKLSPYRQWSIGEKDHNRAATKRTNASGQRDCQASASFRKVNNALTRRILSTERSKPIQLRSPKLSRDRAERAVSDVRDNSTRSEDVHDVLTTSPGDSAQSKYGGVAVAEKTKYDDITLTPWPTVVSPTIASPVLGGNEKQTSFRVQRRTSDPMSLRPHKFKRLVRNRLSDIVGQKRKSQVNTPLKCELREKKSSSPKAQMIHRGTSDPSSFTMHKIRVLGRSLSEIPKGRKKLSAAGVDSKNHKGSSPTVERKTRSPRGSDTPKPDMDTEEVKSAVHKRLYFSVSSQSISLSASNHVEGFQMFKVMTRGSFSDKDVTENVRGGKGNASKWKGFFPTTKLDSPVDVIAENSRSPSRLSDTLTTVNEVSYENASEEQRAGPTESLAKAKEKSLRSPGSDKEVPRLTGIHRHRRQGVDNSSKGDDASQKNTYLDMLFSERIPKAKQNQKKRSPDDADLSSSVDPAWLPKTNPADSYFVQTPLTKPEVYGVREMLSDLRKVRTAGKSGDLQEKNVSAVTKHDRTPSRDVLANKTKEATPKPNEVMSAKKNGTVEVNKRNTRISFGNAILKTGTMPIRPKATQAQKSFGEMRSSTSRSLKKEQSLATSTKNNASLVRPVNAAKPSAALRINGTTIKTPTHERVLRTNIRQAHLSKNAASMRQADKQKGTASKAPLFKVKNDSRSDKTPLPAKPHVIVVLKRVPKTNPTRETTHKDPPKEAGQPVDREDIYTEPPSEAARRQKLAYMNYVKTGTRLVFPESTIQMIKYITHLGVEDADSSEESLPTQNPSRSPHNQRSPLADESGERSARDKRKAPINEAGDIGVGSFSATESKRYSSARRRSTTVVPKSCESKSKRSKTSMAAEDSKTRRYVAPAASVTLGSCHSGVMKAGASLAHAKKSGLASRLPEQGVAAKRSDRVRAQQGRPSRCAKGEAAKHATPQNRKRSVKTSASPPKAGATKCRKKSFFKAKEVVTPTGNRPAGSRTSSMGKHGYLPLTRRRALRKRLRKPRGEVTFVEKRCDSEKSASLTRSISEAGHNKLAVGFEENIIKLADTLLKPGQKMLNLAYDSIMNLVHFKRGSRAKVAVPAASPKKKSVKRKSAARRTKARTKKQRSPAQSPTLAAPSRPDISSPHAKELSPEDKSRSPVCVPSSSVDAPCPPPEAEPSGDLKVTSQENLRPSSALNKAHHLTSPSL